MKLLWGWGKGDYAAENIEENLTEFCVLSSNIRDLIPVPHSFIAECLTSRAGDKAEKNEIKSYACVPFPFSRVSTENFHLKTIVN